MLFVHRRLLHRSLPSFYFNATRLFYCITNIFEGERSQCGVFEVQWFCIIVSVVRDCDITRDLAQVVRNSRFSLFLLPLWSVDFFLVLDVPLTVSSDKLQHWGIHRGVESMSPLPATCDVMLTFSAHNHSLGLCWVSPGLNCWELLWQNFTDRCPSSHPSNRIRITEGRLVLSRSVRNPMKMSYIGFLKTEPTSKVKNWKLCSAFLLKKPTSAVWGRFFTWSHSQFIGGINSQSIFLHAVSLHL